MNNRPANTGKPVQLGFIYDPDRCVHCRTCEAACKSTRNVEIGVVWRKVTEDWQGEFPEVKRSFFSLSCLHCQEPACLEMCPAGAITKRPEDGLVLVDTVVCNGCRDCLAACPFDVPQFGRDGIMQKCDFCFGIGAEPVCAVHCPTGALEFGDINNAALKNRKTTERYPGPTIPSCLIVKRSRLRSTS